MSLSRLCSFSTCRICATANRCTAGCQQQASKCGHGQQRHRGFPLLLLSPRRDFGRLRPIPRFGHSYYEKSTFLGFMVSIAITLGLVTPFINFDYLEKRFGFRIPMLRKITHSDMDGVQLPRQEDRERGSVASSAVWALDENKKEIHDFMMDEAQKRHKKKWENLDDKEKDQRFVEMMARRGRVEAKEELEMEAAAVVGEETEDEAAAAAGGAKKKVGFRNRKIIEYENRIRQYSTPDKIFRYFATYKVTDDKGHGEVMMTPEDFLRSITPGVQQPERYGLDQFCSVSLGEVGKRKLGDLGVTEGSIFYQLGAGGLISFSDYIFLLTVLSTSRRHFEIAFKMFDLNGDGDVDAREFEVVTNLMKSQSSMGVRHRDHQNTGSTFKGINSGLIAFFFGENREGILTVDKFLEFQRRLQNEILALEFKRKSGSDDFISERDFAELLIAYAGFAPKKKAKMLKRVRKAFCTVNEEGVTNSDGVFLSDYLNFYQVLYSINDIDTALTFYHMAGAPIERETMRHVARTVANVDLSAHLINVVFVLFDENGDGKLSNKEFVSVMKQRAMRGLEKPKDTGIGKIFSAVTKCATDTRPTVLGGMRKTE